MTKYKACIGLEMHCEMSETKTKVFSGAANNYSEQPNSSIRPVDMAFPGTLPVVNKEAVRMALMASMILGCSQPEYMYFERKNYYYPDLPKGFQITQETKPIPVGIYGKLIYDLNGEEKSVRINNIHLEEDSASQDHFSTYSTINYNRAGVPLLELVTEPDFRSADEAVSFLETMRSIYQYVGISEADSKKGQIRCDVNVSIMNEELDDSDINNYGTKVEIKNVNSFGGVRDAINYEIKRQIELKKTGKYDEMPQQTRRWDEESGTTIYMRSKVDAIDYKYFVEPNIPKFKLSKEWLEEIRKSIPELPSERRDKYLNEYNLPIIDVNSLIKEKAVSDYFNKCIEIGMDPKTAANWITTRVLGYLNKELLNIDEIYLTPEMLKEITDLIDSKKISSKQGKDLFYAVLEEEKEPNVLVKELGMEQISDEGELRSIIVSILDQNEDNIKKYKEGKTNLMAFFVGQTMKETKGKANPTLATQIIKEEIDRR